MVSDEVIVFTKTGGSNDDSLVVEEKYVKFQTVRAGANSINFSAPNEIINNIHLFFESFNDLEPLTMNIENSGDIKYYFRGLTDIRKEKDENGYEIYSFTVTLQELQ
ncbi:MAG: hypothetical protein CIT01_01250 [Methanobacterium sp. BRmetb2]|jgi:hypothetical protein|nr:MAG: hypothetical protein CIT01_01250 [Methanobacterium sp. BRmetb2]